MAGRRQRGGPRLPAREELALAWEDPRAAHASGPSRRPFFRGLGGVGTGFGGVKPGSGGIGDPERLDEMPRPGETMRAGGRAPARRARDPPKPKIAGPAGPPDACGCARGGEKGPLDGRRRLAADCGP